MTEAIEQTSERISHDLVQMMPATAYTSEDVLAWERRHLFAGGWTCLGRVADLFPDERTNQRAIRVGDIGCLVVRDRTDAVRMFANTCRHRGHELMPDGETAERRLISCPYHAWTYDLDGALKGAPGFKDVAGFSKDDHGLVELPVTVWHGWVFGHALHPLGASEVPAFETYVGELAPILAPYDAGALVVADRHTYEVAANWKVIAENYHECYHCPSIHPELCEVSRPDSGKNYALPGQWVGGSMDLIDGMATMSMTGELAATPLPGAPSATVEYVHLLPNLLVSAHPDYVMTHRMVPLKPNRTWIECSWLTLPGAGPAGSAVEFWDITNRQDWGACESVQRGLESPHFKPGPFAPNEDAVARLVTLISTAYREGGLEL